MFILDRFLLKYEDEGEGCQIDPPDKTTLKNSRLIRVSIINSLLQRI